MRSLFLFFCCLLLSTGIHAQASTDSTAIDSSRVDTMHTSQTTMHTEDVPPPVLSCPISGQTSVVSGQTYTYSVSCGIANPVWSASNGLVVSALGSSVTIKWGGPVGDEPAPGGGGPSPEENFPSGPGAANQSNSQLGQVILTSNGIPNIYSLDVTISDPSPSIFDPGTIVPAEQTINAGACRSPFGMGFWRAGRWFPPFIPMAKFSGWSYLVKYYGCYGLDI